MKLHARIWASCAAILAIQMAALAPSISQILASRSASPWLAICTSTGARWGQAGSGSRGAPAPAQPQDPRAFDHCPYCLLQAHAVAIPPGVATMPLDGSLAYAPPKARPGAARAVVARFGSQPRAPPKFC